MSLFSASCTFVKSAIIVVLGPFLHIPGAIDKFLKPQLVNALLTKVVVNSFFLAEYYETANEHPLDTASPGDVRFHRLKIKPPVQ